MVTLTKATLESQLSKYIAKVIDNEVSGLNVYKSQLDKTQASFPACFVDCSINDSTITVKGSRSKTDVSARVEIQAESLLDRDNNAEAVRVVLKDQTSSDSDSVTLEENHVRFNRFVNAIEDGYRGNYPKLLRICTINIRGVYYGG